MPYRPVLDAGPMPRVARATLLSALVLGLAGGARAEPGLDFSFLASYGGKAVHAQRLNDRGEILGRSDGASLVLGDGAVRVLDGHAVALNDLGQAAGSRGGCAAVWSVDGQGRCVAGLGDRALDLNDRGEVLGTGNRLLADGHVVRLPGAVLGQANLDATGGARRLNDAGEVLGTATSGLPRHSGPALTGVVGVVWGEAGARTTSLVGSINFFVGGLNDQGDAVATVYDPSRGFVAMMDRSGHAVALRDLDDIPGWSFANAVNNDGHVVGRSAGVAVRWVDGVAQDLNAWLPLRKRAAGWVLTDALDVNEDGSIVGMAFNTSNNRERGFVLWAAGGTAAAVGTVPEPSTFALSMLGLLGLGALVRGRGAAASLCAGGAAATTHR